MNRFFIAKSLDVIRATQPNHSLLVLKRKIHLHLGNYYTNY